MKLTNPLERVREVIQSGMGPAAGEGRAFAFIQVDQLDPNPYQPRRRINEESLDDLRRSIQESGVIEPIVVRRKEDRYEIISGERRWRACRELGMEEIPCVLKNVPDEEAFRLALVENLQRNALTPLEEALAFRRLLDLKVARTQADIGKLLGIRQQRVSDKLKLLDLPEEVQSFFGTDSTAERFSQKHGELLLRLRDPVKIQSAAKRVISEALSTRETSKLVEKLLNAKLARSIRGSPSSLKIQVHRHRHGFTLKVRFDDRRDVLEDTFEDLDKMTDTLRKEFGGRKPL